MKKKVIILATGGTIAGVGEEGKIVGYKSGSIKVNDLIDAMPKLKDVADIEAMQICNINSDDITDKIWIKIANTINELAKDSSVVGFVITHGTDTMEETAYFLNLTVKTDKPVVFTGSMRPATAISADGYMNLYEAVCVASSNEAKGKGVLVVFSDCIFAARTVTKTSTYNVTAISSSGIGAIGIVRDGAVYLYSSPSKCHTNETIFDVSSIDKLPKVSILYFHVDADDKFLDYVSNSSDGIIIAGAGAGEFSESYKAIIEKLEIPIVVCSRIDGGIIFKENLLCKNTIAADNLSPQKAVVLLRLALACKVNKDKLQEIFMKY